MPPTEESAADAAYEWTMRVLYTVLIVGNLALAYEAWKDTAAGTETRARARRWVDRQRLRAQNCEGCAQRKEWLRRQTHGLIFEAEEIVIAARRADDASTQGPE